MIAQSELTANAPGKTSLVHVFQDRVARSGSAVAAKFKQGGAWQDMTWATLQERALRVAHALVAAGVERGDRVCLMGDTKLEWVICDLGIQLAGAVTVPIYQSNLPDECQYIAENCGAKAVLVDTAAQAAKFAKVQAQLPSVAVVVQYTGDVASPGWVRPLEALQAEGDALAKKEPGAVEARWKGLGGEDLSTIIYTSGTTGRPKGVMLTHASFVYEAEAIDSIGIINAQDVELIFLPLAHVFAQVLKAIWYRMGHEMAFAESIEKLMDNMGEVRPTFMASVPRVFEKAYNKVVTDGSANPGLAGKLFRMTMREFEHYAVAKDKGQDYSSLSLTIGKKLVLPKVKGKLDARFGGRLRFFISGGAPLSRKIARFFDLAGVQILEGFGLTETCAATTVNRPDKNKIGTVGPTIPGTQVKIAQDGEILIKGPGVMRGYFNNEAATKEVLSADGWFATGDIGELDGDGFLRITDRKKDLIITAGGKNVAPQNIENALKAYPIVSQAVVYGDKRKYLTAIVTVADEPARKLAQDKGVAFKDYAELTQKPEVRAAVQAAFDAINANLPSYETIKKFEVLPNDFAQDTGELTPTLKVKRKFCNQKYAAVFEKMYGADGGAD